MWTSPDDLLNLGGTFFQIQFDVAVDVFDRNIAVLVVDFDIAIAAGDGNIAAARGDVKLHFAGDGDIQIALHRMVCRQPGFWRRELKRRRWW